MVQRDVPLPVGEIGTHAVQYLVEHAHPVRSSPHIGTVAPLIVARPPRCRGDCPPGLRLTTPGAGRSSPIALACPAWLGSDSRGPLCASLVPLTPSAPNRLSVRSYRGRFRL